jgi:dTDP-4-dehydrorhamnose 3,5-epimerase
MKFSELALPGVFAIEPELFEDERGFFARSFCKEEFKHYGLNPQFEQCNISFNHKKGTLRGMHYQVDEQSEAKLVRCTMGKIFDVVIDLRPHSKTYKQWLSIELSAHNRTMLYIPEGFAHGFQTLEDHTEVFYQMSVSFAPSSARGIRWNDPHFRITWPIEKPSVISLKDQHYQDFALR